jgi:hypothetical protein
MDSFQGTGTINLQRGTSNVPYRFQITVATSSNRNDGALPYGSTVAAFTILAHPVGSTRSSTQFIIDKRQDGSDLITLLTWTTQLNPGMYQMEFKVVCSVNHLLDLPLKRQFDFARIILKERR